MLTTLFFIDTPGFVNVMIVVHAETCCRGDDIPETRSSFEASGWSVLNDYVCQCYVRDVMDGACSELERQQNGEKDALHGTRTTYLLLSGQMSYTS